MELNQSNLSSQYPTTIVVSHVPSSVPGWSLINPFLMYSVISYATTTFLHYYGLYRILITCSFCILCHCRSFSHVADCLRLLREIIFSLNEDMWKLWHTLYILNSCSFFFQIEYVQIKHVSVNDMCEVVIYTCQIILSESAPVEQLFVSWRPPLNIHQYVFNASP